MSGCGSSVGLKFQSIAEFAHLRIHFKLSAFLKVLNLSLSLDPINQMEQRRRIKRRFRDQSL